MQTDRNSCVDGTPKLPGHRRNVSTLGKSMPVTSLLLNFPPPSMSTYRCQDMGDQRERPPMYFAVPDMKAADPSHDHDDIEHDYEIIVSDASEDDSDNDDPGGECKVNAAAKPKRRETPCLTCTGRAPPELGSRDSAINEMCRRFCTDECRMRLSLGGFLLAPPTPPPPPPSPMMKHRVPHANEQADEAIVERRRGSETIRLQRARYLQDLLKDNENDAVQGGGEENDDDDDDGVDDDGNVVVNGCVVPPPPLELKDFRERFEIAEALAKTSAMTSTTQIKQRLAARKLEFELENAAAVAAAAAAGAAKPEKLGADRELWSLALTSDAGATSSGAKAAATAASMLLNETEPPRDLLLYLVSGDMASGAGRFRRQYRDYHTVVVIAMLLRKAAAMGSFNSAPKIHNLDSQDDGLDIPKGLNTSELLQHVKLLRGLEQPPLLSRYFLKPSMAAQMVSNDITEGLRSLKLNPLTRTCNGPNSIRLLQWNILSQSLGQNNDGFVCCPQEALTWDSRKFLIVQEILQHNPDIICLQEVDHFKFLQTILATQNYRGIFFPKPDSPCLYIEQNNGPDGCAIFYRSDKFELRHHESRILEVWRVQSNQVAIAVALQMKSNGSELCVCTTHLKARHGALLSKLRNEQGRDLLRFVKAFAGERPVLLCGDFNAEPTEPVYTTVLNCEALRLASAYSDIKGVGDEHCDKSNNKAEGNANGNGNSNGHCAANGDNDDGSTSDSANESSAENVEDDEGDLIGKLNGQRSALVQQSISHEPPYTTWKIREDGEVCHTIDYVFYNKDRFKVSNCLEFPPEDEIGKNRTPSFQYPSDHFSLVCDFEVLQPSQPQGEQQEKFKNQ